MSLILNVQDGEHNTIRSQIDGWGQDNNGARCNSKEEKKILKDFQPVFLSRPSFLSFPSIYSTSAFLNMILDVA